MIQLDQLSLPVDSGVYLFKDKANEFLYIGKAKNLKRRIASYFTDKQVDWKLALLLKRAVCVETIITASEKEALLLEAELISRHKPIFNRLLTSSTPFTYIVYESKPKELSRLLVTRVCKKDDRNVVVGPFLTKKEALIVYKNILEFFNLYRCGKKIAQGCLYFHIGKCAGECRIDFDSKGYEKRFELAKKLFAGEHLFEHLLEKKIEASIKNFDFDGLEQLYLYKEEYKRQFAFIFEEPEVLEELVERALFDLSMKSETIKKGLVEIKELCRLSHIPRDIDCVDISHFQGHAVVGACVRFSDGVFSKKESKSYKMPYELNNDYLNLTFLVQLHYESNKTSLPDLLLIDGGRGQLGVIKKLNLKTTIVALAKREELLFFPDEAEPVQLSLHEASGTLLIAIRNTAHNAAVAFHGKFFNQIR